QEWNPTPENSANLRLVWWVAVYVVTHATLYYEKTTEGNKERHEIGGNWRGSKVIATNDEGTEFETDRITITYEFDLESPSTNLGLEFRAAHLNGITIDDYVF